MSVIFHRSKNINMAIRIFIRISGIKWLPVAIIVRLTNWARSFFSPPSPLSPRSRGITKIITLTDIIVTIIDNNVRRSRHLCRAGRA